MTPRAWWLGLGLALASCTFSSDLEAYCAKAGSDCTCGAAGCCVNPGGSCGAEATCCSGACEANRCALPPDGGTDAGTGGGGGATGGGGGATGGGGGSAEERRFITVVNVSDAGLPVGFTVHVTLDAGVVGRALTDFSDVRLFDTDGGERDRIVDEGPPGAATLWFALPRLLPVGGDAGFWLAYGAGDGGPAPAEGRRIFRFFDGFDGGPLSGWTTIDGGSPTAVGGFLTLPSGGDEGVSAISDGIGFNGLVEIGFRFSQASCGTGSVAWFGFQESFQPGSPRYAWMLADSILYPYQQSDDFECRPPPNACRGADEPADPSLFHRARIERRPTQTHYIFDGVANVMLTGDGGVAPNFSFDYPVLLQNRSPVCELLVDWVRGANLASAEPVVTVSEPIPW